jgi:hypothetical protein
MRFKRAQILDLLEISPDTLRHWKTALPPISNKDGRGSDYSLAELLSLAIIARATHHLKIQVSLFTDFSTRLFEWMEEVVAQDQWDQVLFITHEEARLVDPSQVPEADSIIAIKIRPVMEEVQRRMGATRENPNEPFLPFAI